MAKENKAATTSIFSVGGLSTTAVGISELTLTDYPIITKVIALACPVVMSIIVWIGTRLLNRVEPYTNEQLSLRTRISNELKLIEKDMKSSSGDEEILSLLRSQKLKLLEERGKLAK